MTPDWLKLIRHHQRRRRLALTLPFLVGALRQPIGAVFWNEREAYAALVSLLTRFRDEAPDSDSVRIFTCPDLAQPVASVNSIRYHPSYARCGMARPEIKPLDIDPPFRPEQPTDVSTPGKLLWAVVSLPIIEARFSYSAAARTYQPFDDADRKLIDDALAYDEENEL